MTSTQSPSAGSWTAEHDRVLLEAIMSAVLSNRIQIYAHPGLSTVTGNRADRVSKKIQQVLKKLAGTIPGGEGMVMAAMAAAGNRGSGGGSPKKRKAKDEAGMRKVIEESRQKGLDKKRKVKVEENEVFTDE